jgi:hypothetical protein
LRCGDFIRFLTVGIVGRCFGILSAGRLLFLETVHEAGQVVAGDGTAAVSGDGVPLVDEGRQGVGVPESAVLMRVGGVGEQFVLGLDGGEPCLGVELPQVGDSAMPSEAR